MAKEIKAKDTDKHFWCAWGGDVCHFGKLEADQVVTSGQTNLENYKTEAELSIKVDELKGANYYYVHTTEKPVINDSKAEIQAWLTEKSISFESSNTKAELIELI
jgi:hypothetical protein